MGHRHNRAAELVAEAAQLVQNPLLVREVELTGGLVGQHERRIPRECDSDGDTLLFSTRKGPRTMRRARRKIERPECRGRHIAGGSDASEAHGCRDVLSSSQEREQVLALEDDRHAVRTERCELGLVEPIQRLAKRAHLTGRRLLEPGGELEEGALPGPGRPEHGNMLALLDAQVEAAQRDGLRRARAVDLEDVVELERRRGPFLLARWLAVEARHLHLKLWIISRYASTLSTPTGVPRSTTA